MTSATFTAVLAGALALLSGCTFPDVTFGPPAPEAGPALVTVDDAAPSAAPADADAILDGAAGDGGADGAGGPDAACDFNGTWGSRLTIDVSWTPQGLTGIILAPGMGQITQWVKGARAQNGTALSDTSVVCGVILPDFNETAIAGAETYGVKFPDSLFDDGYLPTFTVSAALVGLSPGATYGTTTTASLLGLTMNHPTTDPWPATITTEADMDRDGKPGVTVGVAQGAPYSNIPTELPAGLLQQPARASGLYLAIRQVTIVQATVKDCDNMAGTVQIPQLQTSSGTAKYAIDSHILGCALVDGGDCTTGTSGSQATFVDNTEPIFTPTGTTDFQSVRMAPDASCGDVRARLP